MHRPAQERLRPFRLNDIPLDVRLHAARHAHVRVLPDDNTDGRDRLFAALTAARPDDGMEREALDRAARAPSDRVYWVTAKAWARVMG